MTPTSAVSPCIIHIAAALLLNAQGQTLLVRKRGTTAFMQPGGKIEAQENPPNFIRASKLHEHQKYLMTTHHMPQRQFVLASQARWQQLPQATRDLLAQAATIAHQQGALAWELRSATSLAQLWQRQNRCREALDLLNPIYQRFTEGYATPDLRKVRLLLDELGRQLRA